MQDPRDLEDELEDDDQLDVHHTDEFDRRYMDERSWETLREDEHGRLVAAGQPTSQRKRVRAADAGVRIRRGLMRCDDLPDRTFLKGAILGKQASKLASSLAWCSSYFTAGHEHARTIALTPMKAATVFRYLQLVLDMSETCASSTDMAPNRAVALVALAKKFITEFFDQNPLSQMSVVLLRHGVAHTLTEFNASPVVHRRAFESSIDTGGAVSLQNMLELCSQVRPPCSAVAHGVVVVHQRLDLTTCDSAAWRAWCLTSKHMTTDIVNSTSMGPLLDATTPQRGRCFWQQLLQVLPQLFFMFKVCACRQRCMCRRTAAAKCLCSCLRCPHVILATS